MIGIRDILGRLEIRMILLEYRVYRIGKLLAIGYRVSLRGTCLEDLNPRIIGEWLEYLIRREDLIPKGL